MGRIKDIEQAIEFNKHYGLYASDAAFMRVYFTYSGGRYNGQRGDIKSEYYLDKLKADLKAGLYDITDIEVISTGAATKNYFDSMRSN